MKKCAIIIKLVPEALQKDNEAIRQEILDEVKKLVIPYRAEITEVAVWSES